MNLKGRRVLVLGMGETGLSIVKWLSRQEAIIRVADNRLAPPHLDSIMTLIPAGDIFTGPFESKIFETIEIIAMSPGVPLSDPHVQNAISSGVPVVGDMAMFSSALEQNNTENAKVLAITGTNGKTTVTAMVGAMAKAAGLDVAVAGNIGPAVLDVLMRRLDSGKICIDRKAPFLRRGWLPIDLHKERVAGGVRRGNHAIECVDATFTHNQAEFQAVGGIGQGYTAGALGRLYGLTTASRRIGNDLKRAKAGSSLGFLNGISPTIGRRNGRWCVASDNQLNAVQPSARFAMIDSHRVWAGVEQKLERRRD